MANVVSGKRKFLLACGMEMIGLLLICAAAFCRVDPSMRIVCGAGAFCLAVLLLFAMWQLLHKNIQLQNRTHRLEVVLRENASAIRQSVILQLIHGDSLTEEQVVNAFDGNLQSVESACVLAMVRFPYSSKLQGNFHAEIQRQAQRNWLEVCKTLADLKGEWFWSDQLTILGLLLMDESASEVQTQESLQALGASIQGHEANGGYESPFVAFSQQQTNLLQCLPLCYRQAEKLVNQKLHTHAQEPFCYEPTELSCPSFEPRKHQLLTYYIQAGRTQEAANLLNTYFSILHADPRTQCSAVKKQCIQMISTVSNAIYDDRLQQDTMQNVFRITRETLERQTSVHECAETVLSLVQTVCTTVGNTGQNKSSAKVEKLTQWISENYQKDVSLDDLASQIGCSASYTSKLFKSVTGVELVGYLNSVRVEHVKQLLRTTQLPVSEITILAGFNSQQTMIRNFKKNLGITPSEYRAKCCLQDAV